MSISDDEVRAMAKLARLAIEESDIPIYAEQVSHILELVGQMNDVDTTDVEPMAHPQDLVARLRPDRVTESDNRDAFQRNAPRTEDGLYLVPQVIE
jgi:aspartyl-tRNA(Asn)/glutamyl-tRNA(Gln) amidotransferase subunit C